MKIVLPIVALFAAFFSVAHAQAFPRLDADNASRLFEEARDVSSKEGGKLWGTELYGPIILIDLDAERVIANEPDTEGILQSAGGVYTGALPDAIAPANTPTEWAGKRWTMLIWQSLPEDRLTRQKMLAHEMFHRVQPALNLMARDSLTLHLDTTEGRIWLQLEWRALAAALISEGAAQEQAIRDALAFRAHRREMFPGAAAAERSQEIAEGVPEYTGLIIAAPDAGAARWRAVASLADPDTDISYVRSFAYVSGPPYGLLLDQRSPGWRAKLSVDSDLGGMLAATVKRGASASAERRASAYGAAAIRNAEADRAARIEEVKSRYRELLVEGPTLTLPNAGSFSINFNPSTIISLDDETAVYPTLHASDAWGTLDVKDGALLKPDFSSITVSAPTSPSGRRLTGEGWTLDLAEGWRLSPSSKPDSYIVEKDRDG